LKIKPGETARIVELPTVEYPATGYWTRRLRKHPDAPDLLPVQEQFLEACRHAGSTIFSLGDGPGVVGLISCGGGKTLSLQLASLVFGIPRERVVLVTEANLIPQTRKAIAEWSVHYPCQKPEILSYGRLSHPSGQTFLEEREPHLILADEAHKLGSKSARYRRVLRYLASHGECRFVAVTGTLMRSSIADMAHIMELSLREWSPVPRIRGTLAAWSSVLDPGGEPAAGDWSSTDRVVEWAGLEFPEDTSRREKARLSVQHRTATAPGVVVSRGPLDVPVSLQVRRVEPEIHPKVAESLQNWELPDGTELVDSFEVHRHTQTLRCGFFYRFRDEDYLPAYLEVRRAWGRAVRRLVEYGGFETPFFAEEAAREGRLSAADLSRWNAWTEMRDRYPSPETEAVWVEPNRIRRVVDRFWKGGQGGVVWVQSIALREKFAELYGDELVVQPTDPFPDESFHRCIVPMSFHKGWEGQAFHRALLLQPSRRADRMEQVLSRHHRPRQTRDVEVTIHYTEREHWIMVEKARALAQVTGNVQRYLIADYVDEDN